MQPLPSWRLLGGWSAKASALEPLAAQLSGRSEILSARQAQESTLEALTAPVFGQAPILLGWSLGGLLALKAALQAPKAFSGLVLIATPVRMRSDVEAYSKDSRADSRADAAWPGVDPRALKAMRLRLRKNPGLVLRQFWRQALGRPLARVDEAWVDWEAPIDALDRGLFELETSDLRPNLPQLSLPSLWLAGEVDAIVPSAAVLRAAEATPGAAHRVIAEAEHDLLLRHTEALAAAIETWRRTLPPRESR